MDSNATPNSNMCRLQTYEPREAFHFSCFFPQRRGAYISNYPSLALVSQTYKYLIVSSLLKSAQFVYTLKYRTLTYTINIVDLLPGLQTDHQSNLNQTCRKMAMSSTAHMQSFLASPVGSLSNRPRLSPVVPSLSFAPRMQRNFSRLQVRSMAEDDTKPEVETATSSPPPQPKPISPKPKFSTNFGDLFAFSGPAPERINGRLAMIGFVAAIAVELSNGTDLFDQISAGGGQWFLGTSILLSVASLVPLFKGVRTEGKGGFMNSDAELWNGRLAMLGLVALAFTEYVKGGALV